MADIKDICNEIMLAKACLEKAHKSFNALNATNEEALDRDERKAWQAGVSAIDAIAPVYDWALDNC